MARPFPLDQIEHELRSLRMGIMQKVPQAPPVVRIVKRDSTFARPSLDISHVTSTNVTTPTGMQSTRRAISMIYWSVEEEEEAFRSAHSFADWMPKFLTRFGVRGGPDHRVFDFSRDEPVQTPICISIEPESIVARTLPDELGFWTSTVDLRYEVTTGWPEYPAPAIENISGLVGVPFAAKITIP